MEKETKLYVKCLIWGREWQVKEVDSLDPELIDVKDVTCFEFIEKTIIKDGEEVYTGKEKKASPTYHVGVRHPIQYAIDLAEGSYKQFYERMANEKGYQWVCHSDFGYIELMENDSVTLAEYRETKHKKNK